MKLTIFLVVLSLGAMTVMISQAVRQEMNLHYLKNLAREKATDVVRKEQYITEMKKSIQGIKPKLQSMHAQTEALKKKKDKLQKEKVELEANLGTCNNEKGEAEKKKVEVTETLTKQKSQHEEAKQNAQKEIQDLKQKNLDREKAICAIVDTTNAEARKLCGLPDTPQ